jgi:ATP-dependent DNA helicase RecG
MSHSKSYEFLLKDITTLKRVGQKTKKLLKKIKIETLFDVLWHLPQAFVDRSNLVNVNKLEIGKICTMKVQVIKYNIPRIRNLPNTVRCEDSTGKVDIVFFNSREGYIRKILPLNEWVIISGKVNYYNKKYQITNPAYVVSLEKEDFVKRVISRYSLTEGITEKIYRNVIEQVLQKLPFLTEWHDENIMENFDNKSWRESMLDLHDPRVKQDFQSNHFKRLAYDEILSSLIVLSQIRKRIKKIIKKPKKFRNKLSNKIISNLRFQLTKNQIDIINEINIDISSQSKMFRLLQGDVGSGKTIVALIAAANVVESGYQVAFMAPTEILTNQHYSLANKIFSGSNIKTDFLTGKTSYLERNKKNNALKEKNTNIIFGTHALFQKKTEFGNLGLIIIDEQHKFGVKQRMELSKKGGEDCDILVMSATPIPRTLIMTFYGDMDVSKLIEKPSYRKEIISLSKPEVKINEVINFIKKEITTKNQIFWVCPLINESKKLDYEAAVKKFEYLNKIFTGKVGLIHGSLKNEQKEIVLKNFLNKKIQILVSTTVIEVGIDFPNANVIVIENSNKFGLSQLHQLRGRVGRSNMQGTCILLYKKNLSENAKKRVNILKSTNDGFKIADEDMKLRGFGDILGYKQSGIKEFKLADPIHHEKLFKMAEINIKEIENKEQNLKKYEPLIKLYDKAEIINQIDS